MAGRRRAVPERATLMNREPQKPGASGRSRPLAQALRLGPRGWLDLGRAAAELARARWRLRRHSVRDLVALGQRQAVPARPLPAGHEEVLDRVAFAVPRIAARVPWRADCWIQALAAQSWLAREGVPAEIWIGVRQDRGGFEAHAWLRSGDRAVTGGDGEGFVPLVTPDGRPPGPMDPGPGAP